MAIRSVATTSTLEGFRTTFNSLGTDVGDLASLGTTDTSSIVAAINEADDEVKDTFQEEVNIFSDKDFGEYVPLGSNITVEQRRVIVAAGATIMAAAAPAAGGGRKKK